MEVRRQGTLTVHTCVRRQRIQWGGEEHQAYGPWAIHRDMRLQLLSYKCGSRSQWWSSRRSVSKTLFILFSKEVVGSFAMS